MATKKSDLATTLDALQAKIRPALKERDFRARGRAFNRTTSDGLTEVVQLQMGSFDPPRTAYIPGLRENLYAIVPPRIVCAIILAERGWPDDARALLTAQARETTNPGHPAYVRRLADKLGLGSLEL